jgi:hypothetical protein
MIEDARVTCVHTIAKIWGLTGSVAAGKSWSCAGLRSMSWAHMLRSHGLDCHRSETRSERRQASDRDERSSSRSTWWARGMAAFVRL